MLSTFILLLHFNNIFLYFVTSYMISDTVSTSSFYKIISGEPEFLILPFSKVTTVSPEIIEDKR